MLLKFTFKHVSVKFTFKHPSVKVDDFVHVFVFQPNALTTTLVSEWRMQS